ncbi:hypothetical protein JCM33374_g32 [Metschnikowia sp. JCM 33374]|nr:hypothetical protein JCM33374_g32 [Metschnikowia sp. JCM 33374]
MESLSPTEQDALNEFVVVTGVSLDEEETMQKAMALLAHYNYNLNNAVLAFFDQGFDLPAPVPEQAPVPETATEYVPHSDFDNSSFASGV